MAPFYPGLSAETELYYASRPHFKCYQTIQAGGFLNSSSGSALYLNSNFGMRYAAEFGLTADLSFGLGYFHTFYTSPTFTQNESGAFVESNKRGIGAMSGNISLGLGYDLSKKTETDMRLFLRYQWIASTYYWSLITIRPNGLLHLGVTIHPFK